MLTPGVSFLVTGGGGLETAGVTFLVTGGGGLETAGVTFLVTGGGLETVGVTGVPGDELEGLEVGADGVGGGPGEGLVREVRLLHLGVSLDFEVLGNLFFVGLALMEACLPISELETVSWPKSISNNLQRSENSADSVWSTCTSPAATILVRRNSPEI